MRGMPRVVTLSTWVSPRWNSAEPWAVGKRSISADRGRMSDVPRPSTRTPSSTMRLRTSFLVSERMAALTSPARPSNSSASAAWISLPAASSAALRSALAVTRLALAMRSVPDRLDPGPHVVGVVGEGGELDGLDRPAGGHEVGHQLALQVDGLADPGLGRLQPLGQHLLGDLGRPRLVVVPGVLGPAGLDHHDGDVGVGGVGQRPAGHHQLEGGGLALFEGRVRDPGALDACRPPGRRRWGRRRGCPRSSARPTRR